MAATAQLDWIDSGQARSISLDSSRLTIGKGSADISIPDRTVSRLHAALEQVTGGWVLQDLGSRNGTYVNGVRVLTPRALRSGDSVRFGSFTATFHAGPTDASVSMTAPLEAPPLLTRREQEALLALSRPVLAGSMLEEPASVGAIADELSVSESAIKKLLTRLYDKFGLRDEARRRGVLVVEAIRRGAVSVGDVERGPSGR